MFPGATAQAPKLSHQRDLPQVLLKPTRLILVAGDELFLNVEQIIPTPEASDFMIGMMAEGAEGKGASQEQSLSNSLRKTRGRLRQGQLARNDSVAG